MTYANWKDEFVRNRKCILVDSERDSIVAVEQGVEAISQVDRGLVPHQPCFGVLTTRSRSLLLLLRVGPPSAGKREAAAGRIAILHRSTPKRIHRGQAPNGWSGDL